MKKRLSWKKISAIGAGAVMAMSLAFGMGFSNLFTNTATDNSSVDSETTQNVEGGGTNREVKSNFAAITYPSGEAQFGRFPNNFQYEHTDKTTFISIHDQTAADTVKEMKTVTVTNSADTSTWGNSENDPYVITNADNWEAFVKSIATDANNGAGKYYALASDISFSGKTFRMAALFKGTFFGLGYKLKDITVGVNGWAYWNGSAYIPMTTSTDKDTYTSGGFGVFGKIENAVVSDLVVENFNFNAPQQTSLAGGWRGSSIGGVAGVNFGNSFVMNCTTKGFITHDKFKRKNGATDFPGSPFGWPAGIVGSSRSLTTTEADKLYIYRCFSEVEIVAVVDVDPAATTVTSGGNFAPCGAGIIAEIYGGAECYVYDCSANVTASTPSATEGYYSHFGACVGYSNGQIAIENFIGSLNLTDRSTAYSGSLGAGSSISLKNIYVEGKYRETASSPWKYLIMWPNTCTNQSNINEVKSDGDAPYAKSYLQRTSATPTSPLTVTSYPSKDALLDGAIDSVGEEGGLPSGVWDEEKIPLIGEPYDPDNSPIQSQIVTRIYFANPDETEIALADSAANPGIYNKTSVGVDLPTPAAQTGKDFVGWTLDKNSDATVYTEFPEGLTGNFTMYPVFNMTGVSVAVTATGEGIGATDTTISKEYTGMPVVTLTAALTLPAGLNASDCTVTWSWFKNGTKIDGANTNTLALTELTSGTYSAKVKVVNSNKLWRTDPDNDVASTQSFDITIGKGNLTPNGAITIDPAQKAYWGQALNQADNTLVIVPHMKNADGIEVAGTAAWKAGTTKIEDKEAKTYTAIFTPTDTTRYNSREIDVTVAPTILKLKYAFDPTAVADTAFTFDIEYNAQFTGQELVDKFQPEYFAWLNTAANANAIGNNMPKFNDEYFTTYLELYGTQTRVQFNKATIDTFTTEATFVLDVTFATPSVAPYTATFFTKTDGLTEPTQNLYYGQKVGRPDLSQAGSGSNIKFLQGWFVADAAGEIQKDSENNDIPFDFDNAHVTENVYLAAKWIQGTLEIDHITAKLAQGITSITATTQPQRSQYVVTGIYNVRVDGALQPDQVEILLSAADYDLEYADSSYSVSITEIEIVYAKDGYTGATKKVQLTGLPIEPKYIGVTDYAFTLNEATVPSVSGEKRSTQLASVTFDEKFTLANKGTDYYIEYTFVKDGVQLKFVDTGSGLASTDGVDEIGTYNVRVKFDFTKGGTRTPNYLCDRAISFSFEIKDVAKEIVVAWDTAGSETVDGKLVYTYNGSEQHPTAKFFLKDTNTPVPLLNGVTFEYAGTGRSATNAATNYKISIDLKTISYTLVTDATHLDTEIEFDIKKATVSVPELLNNRRTYEKDVIADISGDLGLTSKDLELVTITGATADEVTGAPLTVRIRLNNTTNSMWADGDTEASKTIVWYFDAQRIPVPTFQQGRLVYNGETFALAKKYFIDFNEEAILIKGQNSGKDVGSYIASLKLDGEEEGKHNYVWEDDSFDGRITWSILPKPLTLIWDNWSFTQSAQNPNRTQRPQIIGVDGLTKGDSLLELKYSEAFVTIGSSASTPGSYKIEADFSSDTSYNWLSKNYQIDNSKILYWVIKGSTSEKIIKLQWNLRDNGYYTYNGTVIHPEVVQILDERDLPLDLMAYDIEYVGAMEQWAGSYSIVARITSLEDPGIQFRVANESITYRIVKNGTQGDNPANLPNAGDNPSGGDSQTNNNDNGATGENPSNGFVADLPQIAISGISAVLIVVFVIMAMNYASSAKAAKQKAKKLAQMSYSFAPFGLLVAFGISSSNWWIVAGVLMGLALLSAIVMFAMRGKAKKALAILEEEQERIEEEKEMAREADRDRRDNELKMMFAAMQQNYQQPQIDYDGMQNMISSAVSALLPGLQQQMALPPAQSENDELRAQMARQEEMLNQLLQERQQGYGAPAQEAAAAQAYAEPAPSNEPPVFDSQSDGVVSLEESYGRLSDDFKRFYYEVGVYIMGKPQTAQNDGKYAVLFKYRGKTSFKLSIKNDAPVLAYVMNGTTAEHPIVNEMALAYAKQIVDMCVAQIDAQM